MAYFANSSEGDRLEQQCERCPLGEKACPVQLVQLMFNYDQLTAGQEKLKAAMSMLIDDKGVCQVRPLLVEDVRPVAIGERPEWY